MILIGAKDGPPSARMSGAEYRFGEEIMQNYARCVVSAENHRSIDRFLATNPLSKKADKLGAQIATPSCLNRGTMSFPPALFRAALYDALYREAYGKANVLPTPDQPPLDIANEVESQDPADTKLYVSTRYFGDCIVRREAASVRALLKTNIESKEETASFQALQTSMGACLSNGNKIQFSRQMLRGLLAEALYKLTVAADSPRTAALTEAKPGK